MAQIARPTDDILVSGWTGDPIDTAGNRYQNVDEVTMSETDFIHWASGGNELILGLGSLIDPVSSSGHVLRLRVANQMTYELRQGSTVIASGSRNAGSYGNSVVTLSGAEADAITDYTDLNVRFVGGGIFGADVAWIEFEVPDVPGGANDSLAVQAF